MESKEEIIGRCTRINERLLMNIDPNLNWNVIKQQVIQAMQEYSDQQNKSLLEENEKLRQEKRELVEKVRNAFADYATSAGCGCCRNREKNDEAIDRLGNLLNIDKYSDNSGYDYYKYQTKTTQKP